MIYAVIPCMYAHLAVMSIVFCTTCTCAFCVHAYEMKEEATKWNNNLIYAYRTYRIGVHIHNEGDDPKKIRIQWTISTICIIWLEVNETFISNKILPLGYRVRWENENDDRRKKRSDSPTPHSITTAVRSFLVFDLLFLRLSPHHTQNRYAFVKFHLICSNLCHCLSSYAVRTNTCFVSISVLVLLLLFLLLLMLIEPKIDQNSSKCFHFFRLFLKEKKTH